MVSVAEDWIDLRAASGDHTKDHNDVRGLDAARGYADVSNLVTN